MDDQSEVISLPTATKFEAFHSGNVVICGSHGAMFTGYLAAEHRVRGIIFSDGGVGKDDAGIASLPYLDGFGIPAATVDVASARIGDSDDMTTRGIISHANSTAQALGVAPGQGAADAARAMRAAALTNKSPEPREERRFVLRETPGQPRVVAMDSATLVKPEDAGQIVIAGSHGGLMGNNPATAITEDVLAVTFSDGGIGIEEAGLQRLPVLDVRNIAAAAVDVATAHIGDGRSNWESGVISRANETAKKAGAEAGMTTREWADAVVASLDRS